MKKRALAWVMAGAMLAGLVGCGGGSSASTTAAPTTAGQTEAQTTAAASAETTAAQAASGEQVTLKIYWWGNQIRNDVTKKAADLYMSLNPNVKIELEFTDWGGYWDKLAAMAAGGNLPDLIQMDYSYLNQYQKSGQLMNLTPSMEDGSLDVTKIPESIIESGSVDGNCYALSLGSNAPTMVYDKAITDEAGVTIPEQPTYEELLELGNTIYEKTGAKTTFDTGFNGFTITARSQNSCIFDELKEGKADSALKHMNYVKQFNDAECGVSRDILIDKDPKIVETKPILDGTTWNDFPLSNQYVSIVKAAGRDLEMCVIPQPADAQQQTIYLKPSMFFSIAETSKNKAEAVKFLNWFTNDVDCNKILMGERGVPINTDVAEALKPELDANTAKVFDYVAKVSEYANPIDPPDPAGKGEVEAALERLVEEVCYGEISPEDAANTLAADAQKILSEAAQ